MNKLSEESFAAIKSEIQDGRLTLAGMRGYLMGLLLISGFFVGLSFAVANANTVGWDTLSSGWHMIYYMEAVLFSIHILLLLFCWGSNQVSQKMLSVGMVLFTYKAAFDPYLMVIMFSKDEGKYDSIIPIILIILVSGFILHLVILFKWIKSLKDKKKKTKERGTIYFVLVPVVAILTTITTIVIKNGMLGEFDLLFGLFIVTVVYLGLLIGVCEFIIAMYCIFKFPSFSVKNFNEK